MQCLVCGKELKRVFEDSGIPVYLEAWDNGGVHTFVPGYGSDYDNKTFIIALCDDCIAEKLKQGLLTEVVWNETHSDLTTEEIEKTLRHLPGGPERTGLKNELIRRMYSR